ncbi:MAG: DUF3887 domain-containing protein [Bacillota bacterium]|nr:DUF3887 domain-containing protein [Bacillota bacterium]
MMKRIYGILLMVTCCLLFAGCGGARSISEDFCDLLFQGKYQDAAAMMNGAMRKDLTEEKAEAMLVEVNEGYGAYEKNIYVSSDTTDKDMTLVTLEIQCSKGEFRVSTIVDHNNRIGGIQLLSDKEEDNSQNITADSEAASAFVNALFQEDYDKVMSMMSQTLFMTMDRDACKTLVQESQGLYGDFDEVGAVTVEGATAYVSTIFAEKSVIFSVTFDNDGMVSAFSSLGEGQ